MMPSAPARFSTITGCPNDSDRRCAMIRPGTSTAPPGAKPMMMRTGLTGYFAASPPLTGGLDGCCAYTDEKHAHSSAQEIHLFIDETPPAGVCREPQRLTATHSLGKG